MSGRYRVNWLRRDRAYVVIDNGKEIGRFDELTEAWAVAESLERDHAQRVAARRTAASEAATVRAAKMRAGKSRRLAV